MHEQVHCLQQMKLPNLFISDAQTSYLLYPVIRESIIEGIEVIQETSSVKKMQSNQELVTLEDPSRAHLNIITDIAIVGSTQQLIASSSQDGVLKLWK